MLTDEQLLDKLEKLKHIDGQEIGCRLAEYRHLLAYIMRLRKEKQDVEKKLELVLDGLADSTYFK